MDPGPTTARHPYSYVDRIAVAAETLLALLGPLGMFSMSLCMLSAGRDDLDRVLQIENSYALFVLWQAILLPLITAGFLVWRHYARPRSFFGQTAILVSVGITVVITLVSYLPAACFLMSREHDIRKARAEAIKKTVDLHRLAGECISLLNKKELSNATLFPGRGELPDFIESLRPVSVDIGSPSRTVRILMVPDFDPENHESFYLTERPGKGVYDLEWAGEYDNRELLLAVPLQK